ncbi:MAG: hypothetical protein LAQ30_32260 [Acidobacteriia bacterium]|nr:hypothetical protein [Terriglobia bacterium]
MKSLFVILIAAAPACFAQQWEFGAGAGGSFLTGAPVTASAGSATAGFKPGAAFGVFFGQDLYRRVSGEIRYGFIMSDLRLQGGGQEATFAGQSHVLHYDILLHTIRGDNRKEFFAAFGGGMKIFRGTGKETAYQPLMQYALLTKSQAVEPMVSVGGGVKFAIAPRVSLRLEVRDYITPFPKDVIAPAAGAKIGGTLLHDIVPMVTLSFGM